VAEKRGPWSIVSAREAYNNRWIRVTHHDVITPSGDPGIYGTIHYKKADIQEASVRVIGTTAIVMNRIRLLAVVGGNEVTNPFMVTEVYVREGEAWKLAQLSFSKTLGE